MPKGKKAGTKNDMAYEHMRAKGYSKEKAAKIANSMPAKRGSSRKR